MPRMRSKPVRNSILEMVKPCPRWSEPFMYCCARADESQLRGLAEHNEVPLVVDAGE